MIESGEVITRATIWVTIVAYTAGAATYALSRKRLKWDSAARVSWTIACVSLLAHVASAFYFYHGWSHQAAHRETARQTNEVVGINWGGGLYVNYALLALWTIDVGWWWLCGLEGYRRRPFWLVSVWHGFLFFIIFNSTVVFGNGWVRWVGVGVCLGVCLAWWLAFRKRSSEVKSPLMVAEE
ncbi:MAG TPA: hypothetical protein VJU86_11075 [Pyrinomonadaceae bacterium]|nr:hypothetical protein [Pyrinomonadaceae bacterium]